MTDLNHSIPINASPAEVYATIATQTGMQGWWTKDTVMAPKVGGKAEFGFDKRGMVFRMTIDDLKPNQTVRMTCSGDQPEWAGTTLEWTIELTPEGSLTPKPAKPIRSGPNNKPNQFTSHESGRSIKWPRSITSLESAHPFPKSSRL